MLHLILHCLDSNRTTETPE